MWCIATHETQVFDIKETCILKPITDTYTQLKKGWLILFSSTVQGDHEVLSEHCSSEMIERCKAERTVLGSQGIFFDNKVREQKIILSASWIWTLLCWFSAQILCLLLKNQKMYFFLPPSPTGGRGGTLFQIKPFFTTGKINGYAMNYSYIT